MKNVVTKSSGARIAVRGSIRESAQSVLGERSSHAVKITSFFSPIAWSACFLTHGESEMEEKAGNVFSDLLGSVSAWLVEVYQPRAPDRQREKEQSEKVVWAQC